MRRRFWIAALVTAAVFACGTSPAGPSNTTGTPFVVSIFIPGPSRVAPGGATGSCKFDAYCYGSFPFSMTPTGPARVRR